MLSQLFFSTYPYNNFNSYRQQLYMKEQEPYENDFIARDDIIIFNSQLSNSGHNIKKFRNHKQELIQRKKAFTTSASHEHVMAFTIDTSEKCNDFEQHEKMKLNFQKLPIRRTSVTAATTRKKYHEGPKTQSKIQYSKTIDLRGSSIKNMDTSRHEDSKDKKQNMFVAIEKKYSKGPLKQKYLESWLNNLLVEACTQEKFDMSTQNPALKKYGLDRNSLLSKGLAISDLNRIYKSLFVYSIGFNDLLNELCKRNMNLRKTIWRVYSVLLEYCAQGHFEVMIAEIERDKNKKVEGLKKQIEKRQTIIENNDEINEKKNEKTYKEIKNLKEQNENLKAEKAILLEEYKQAEQAFNHEVALRLKYENRINEIHGVYSEIQSKHGRLLDQFYRANKECEKFKLNSMQAQNQVIDLKQQLENGKQQIGILKKELAEKQKLTNELQILKASDANINIAYCNRIKDLQATLEEQQKIITQNHLNNENIKLLLESEQKSQKKTRQQLKNSLQENSRLHQTIQSQMKSINIYMAADRDVGLLTKELRTEVYLINSRLSEKHAECKSQMEQMENLRQEIESLETKNKISEKDKQNLKQDLQVCYQKMEDMKESKNKLEEDFESKRKRLETIDEIIDEKNKEISELKEQNIEINSSNNDLKREVQTLVSRVNLMKEKFQSDQQMYKNKLSILKDEKQKIEEEYEQYETVKKNLETDLDRFRNLYNEASQSFKNELFQRENLEMRYDQSLNVMEQENNHIKALNIKISENHEEINTLNRKIKNHQFISDQIEAQHKKQKHFWEKKIRELSIQAGEKKNYIHPMLHEDILGQYTNLIQVYNNLKFKYEQVTTDLSNKLNNTQAELSRKQAKFDIKIKQSEQQHKKAMDRKINEIIYEQEKSKHLSEKTKDLQAQLLLYMEKVKQKLANEKEEKYLDTIKQKSNRIDELMKQLEQAHDKISSIRQNYHSTENKFLEFQQTTEKHKNTIQNLQSENKSLELLKQQLSITLNKKEKQLEEMKKNNNTNQRVPSGKNKESSQIRQGRWKSNDKKESNFEDESKRKDFARKYKGAYIYYSK